MRKNVLPITAGILGSLALAVSASADFTGVYLENKGQYDTAGAFGGPNVGLVDVWNLYALFSDPGDSYSATFVIGGDPDFGEMLGSSDLVDAFDGLGGGFWNWDFGGGITSIPAGALYDFDSPAADADTYLTIGLKSGTYPEGGDAAGFSPGGPQILVDSGILDGTGSITEDFVYFATIDDEQSYPVDGRVLIFQFAVLTGQHASGVWNIQWITPGAGSGQASVEWTTVPAPGALALLGLAGLAGARRRRRLG